MRNPFKPSFGVSPPLLVGRDDLIDDFVDALDDGPGAAARATLYTGARGSGKTVMLNAVEDEAKARGWIVISETASPGFVDRLVRQRFPAVLNDLDPHATTSQVESITAPLGMGGISWDTSRAYPTEHGLRSQVERLTDLLAENGSGLLLTIDEIHRNQIDDLRTLATVVQHAFREERQLAFVGAGLTSAVSDVVNDDVLTFLRRADRHGLGSVGRADVERALREPVMSSGRTLGDDALELMVEGTRGYPFLIQLVGAQVWRLNPNEENVTTGDATQGVANAHRRLGSLVHEPALAGSSDIDKSFLLAMAKDDGPSKMSDIQQRLGVDANYAGQYRLRLIAAELIEGPTRGSVDFALPYLREYLREHAVSDV